jgi:hypothetical protein
MTTFFSKKLWEPSKYAAISPKNGFSFLCESIIYMPPPSARLLLVPITYFMQQATACIHLDIKNPKIE